MLAYEEYAMRYRGLRTFYAGQMLDALRELRTGSFDVVLIHAPASHVLECDLPNVLRQVAYSSYLPIVLITRNTKAADRISTIYAGIDQVMDMKISRGEMIASLHALTRIKRHIDMTAAEKVMLESALHRKDTVLSRIFAANRELKTLSYTDEMTGLHNWRYLGQYLEQAFQQSRRYGRSLSVLLIDIDHFKYINDCYGHQAGDEVLRQLGTRLQENLRSTDVLARYGGDEIVIVMPETTGEYVESTASRILSSVSDRPFETKAGKVDVTLSMGSFSWPAEVVVESGDQMIALADQALYGAKRAGRNRHRRWDRLPDDQRIVPTSMEHYGKELADAGAATSSNDVAGDEGISQAAQHAGYAALSQIISTRQDEG